MTENNKLKQYMLPDRNRRLEEVLNHRTSSIRVVVENFHKEHNVDAILRTSEAFGIQHFHIVPQPGDGGILEDITQGCQRWVTIHCHSDVEECFSELKGLGFRILAGAFDENARAVENVDWSGKVALVFSNELDGAGSAVLDGADDLFVIPLQGFSQSLNVSVAAGITIHHVRQVKERGGELETLTDVERGSLLDEWARKSVRRSEDILKELEKRR
ncbi:hypothetical protein EP232_06060 [bacterium]|nr:MAG: hypothetical protein EP232_06060 [bacterium]